LWMVCEVLNECRGRNAKEIAYLVDGILTFEKRYAVSAFPFQVFVEVVKIVKHHLL